MHNNLEEMKLELEKLLDEPFMAITNGTPSYLIDERDGPEGYEQTTVWLELNDIDQKVIDSFEKDYDRLGKPFQHWATSKGFIDSQILGGENRTLIFEVTAILADKYVVKDL